MGSNHDRDPEQGVLAQVVRQGRRRAGRRLQRSPARRSPARRARRSRPSPETYAPSTDQVDSWLTVHADNTSASRRARSRSARDHDRLPDDRRRGARPRRRRRCWHSGNDTWQVVNSGAHERQQQHPDERRAAAPRGRRDGEAGAAQARVDEPRRAGREPVGHRPASSRAAASRSPTAQLVGGKLLNATISPLTLNPGVGIAKPVSQYKVVGTSTCRASTSRTRSPASTPTSTTSRCPGMLHGRWVRPRGQGAYGTGAKIVSVDESSIKHIPGAQRRPQGRLPRRRRAAGVRRDPAAAQLKVKWKDDPRLPSSREPLEADARRRTRPARSAARHVETTGNVDTAFKSAAKTVSQTYKYHYNGHAVIGPSVCRRRRDARTRAVIYTNTQQLINDRDGGRHACSGCRPKNVRAYFYEGSSSFGEPQTRFDIAPTAAVHLAARSASRCVCSSCAGTSTAGISSGPRS